MDQELKDYLIGMDARSDARFNALNLGLDRLDVRFDRLEERTDARLDSLVTLITDVKESLEREIAASEERTGAKIDSWTRSHDLRLNGFASLVVGFDHRLAIVESRLSELERRHT